MDLRHERRYSIAIPVRISGIDIDGQPFRQSACTVDVNKQGARLYGIRSRVPGEIITIENKNGRGKFQILWIGDAGTDKEAQIGVLALDSTNDIWGL